MCFYFTNKIKRNNLIRRKWNKKKKFFLSISLSLPSIPPCFYQHFCKSYLINLLQMQNLQTAPLSTAPSNHHLHFSIKPPHPNKTGGCQRGEGGRGGVAFGGWGIDNRREGLSPFYHRWQREGLGTMASPYFKKNCF